MDNTRVDSVIGKFADKMLYSDITDVDVNNMLEMCRQEIGIDVIYVMVSLIDCEGYIFRYEGYSDEKYNFLNNIEREENITKNCISRKLHRGKKCDAVVGMADFTGKHIWTKEENELLEKLTNLLRGLVVKGRLDKAEIELEIKSKSIVELENQAYSIREKVMKNRHYQNLLFTAMSDNFVVMNKIDIDSWDVTRFQVLDGLIIEEKQDKKWGEIFEYFISFMHEDEREKIANEYGLEAFSAKKPGDKLVFEYRSTYLNAKNDFRWLRSKVYFMEENERFIAIMYTEDINVEREKQAVLKKANDMLAEALEENRKFRELLSTVIMDNIINIMEVKLESMDTYELIRQSDGVVTEESMNVKWKNRYDRYVAYVHEEDKKKVGEVMSFEALKKADENGVFTANYRMAYDMKEDCPTKNNEYRNYISRVSIMTDDEKKAIISTMDATDTVREQKEQKKILETALEQVRMANEIKDNFLTRISYDMRTPMNAIGGYVSMALSNINETEKVVEYIEKIKMSNNELISVVEDILELKKIEKDTTDKDSIEICDIEDNTRNNTLVYERDIRDDRLKNLLAGRHVLLVEDNEINAEITIEILEDVGVNTEHARNGKEAVDMFMYSKEDYYDLILMDIQMPLMDGYEATRQIRQMKKKDAGDIPIIALSANAFDDDITKSIECGMDAHISKPVEVDKLIEILGAIMSKRRYN